MSSEKESEQKSKQAKESPSIPKWAIGVLAIIIIAAIVFVTQGMWSSDADSDEPTLTDDPVVALVNTERLRQSYVDRRYNEIGEEMRSLMTQEEFLETLIGERLLVQQAKLQNIQISNEDVMQVYQQRLDDAQTDREEFSLELMQKNLTEEDLLSSIQNELLISELLNQAVIQNIEVTDEEIKELYELNKETFTVSEAVHASHILLESLDEAEALIPELTPENFGEKAAELSIDPSANQNNGDLGFFEKGMMVAPFEEVAFRLEKGQISDPVTTQFGTHIILKHDHKEGGLLEFEEVSDFLRNNLLEQRTTLAAQEYLVQLENSSTVNINVQFDESGNII